MSQLLDILTVVIIVLVIWLSYRKGFARSVIELAGYILSFFLSYALSKPFGDWIYSAILRPLTYNGMASSFNHLLGRPGAEISSAMSNFSRFIADNGVTQQVVGALEAGNAKAGQSVADEFFSVFVMPIGQSISRILAFIILFALFMVVVRLIARLSDVVFKVPVIRQINEIGGAVVGVVKAAIIMFILSMLITALIPIFSMQQHPLITQNTVNGTVIYRYINQVNPLTELLLKHA